MPTADGPLRPSRSLPKKGCFWKHCLAGQGYTGCGYGLLAVFDESGSYGSAMGSFNAFNLEPLRFSHFCFGVITISGISAKTAKAAGVPFVVPCNIWSIAVSSSGLGLIFFMPSSAVVAAKLWQIFCEEVVLLGQPTQRNWMNVVVPSRKTKDDVFKTQKEGAFADRLGAS